MMPPEFVLLFFLCFRFIASKTYDVDSNWLHEGDVIDYNYVVGGYFDQQTGIYNVPLTGNYVFVVDAYKDAPSQLKILVNGNEARDIHDKYDYYAPFNGVFSVYLSQNDQVKLRSYPGSTYLSNGTPLTFMGFCVYC